MCDSDTLKSAYLFGLFVCLDYYFGALHPRMLFISFPSLIIVPCEHWFYFKFILFFSSLGKLFYL